MKRLFRVQRPTFPTWILWGGMLSFFGLLYFLFPILPPFLAAAIVAYITYPMARWLNKRGLPAAFSAILVMLLLTLIILTILLIVVPLVVQQMIALRANLPAIVNWTQAHAQPWLNYFAIDFTLDSAHIRTWLTNNSATAKSVITNFIGSVGAKGRMIVSLITDFILFPLVLFYFLRDGGQFIIRIANLIPRRYIGQVTQIVDEVDTVLGEFLRGELIVMIIMSIFYSIGLGLVGLQSALSIGIIAGLLVFIPYLGAGIGILLSTLAAFVQFEGVSSIWPVWAVFLVGQLIEGNFITPKLVGDRIGLHPVVVIFALLAFGQLLGFVGLLLALPGAAILQVGGTHFWHRYRASALYKKSL